MTAGAFRQGRSEFTLEFRTAEGRLVDVGRVSATAAMSMPGMVMSGAFQVEPDSPPGRYHGVAEFGMAGTWQMSLDWQGAGNVPAGKVSFEGAVR